MCAEGEGHDGPRAQRLPPPPDQPEPQDGQCGQGEAVGPGEHGEDEGSGERPDGGLLAFEEGPDQDLKEHDQRRLQARGHRHPHSREQGEEADRGEGSRLAVTPPQVAVEDDESGGHQRGIQGHGVGVGGAAAAEEHAGHDEQDVEEIRVPLHPLSGVVDEPVPPQQVAGVAVRNEGVVVAPGVARAVVVRVPESGLERASGQQDRHGEGGPEPPSPRRARSSQPRLPSRPPAGAAL